MWCIFLYLVHRFPFVFFKQKTAYELRISDWSSDVCSSDLALDPPVAVEDKCRNIAALPIELDARDLALDPLRPVGLRHPAQEARIKTRLELRCIIHTVLGQMRELAFQLRLPLHASIYIGVLVPLVSPTTPDKLADRQPKP